MSRHLGSLVSDYVDRRLDPATLTELDRHVVACQVCRASADQERQLLASLRASPGPAVSTSLRELLLGLATGAAGPPDRAVMVPEVPRAPQPLPGLRLPVVAPAAPALHRSPRRATLLAGFAASASAAVAWGLTAPAAPTTVNLTPASSVRGSGAVVQAAFAPGSVESFTRGSARPARTTEPAERFGR